MIVKTKKEIGRNLALAAIMLPEKQIKNELISQKKFTFLETKRFIFCLYFLNLASIIWWTNLIEKNRSKIQKILDYAIESFENILINETEKIRVGDLVVANEEIKFINKQYGQMGITKNTVTNYRVLLPAVYENRIGQYNSAMNERAKRAFQKNPVLLDPVAKIFVKHFTGDEWKKHTDLVMKLSLIFPIYEGLISDLVEKEL